MDRILSASAPGAEVKAATMGQPISELGQKQRRQHVRQPNLHEAEQAEDEDQNSPVTVIVASVTSPQDHANQRHHRITELKKLEIPTSKVTIPVACMAESRPGSFAPTRTATTFMAVPTTIETRVYFSQSPQIGGTGRPDPSFAKLGDLLCIIPGVVTGSPGDEFWTSTSIKAKSY